MKYLKYLSAVVITHVWCFMIFWAKSGTFTTGPDLAFTFFMAGVLSFMGVMFVNIYEN